MKNLRWKSGVCTIKIFPVRQICLVSCVKSICTLRALYKIFFIRNLLRCSHCAGSSIRFETWEIHENVVDYLARLLEYGHYFRLGVNHHHQLAIILRYRLVSSVKLLDLRLNVLKVRGESLGFFHASRHQPVAHHGVSNVQHENEIRRSHLLVE